MRIVANISAFALRQVLGTGADPLIGFVGNRMNDNSRRMQLALQRSSDQAWRAIEIALAGQSWWERCQVRLSTTDAKSFRRQVEAFLKSAPADQLPGGDANFRKNCLQDLRLARKARIVPGEDFSLEESAAQARALARYTEPRAIMLAEFEALSDIGGHLIDAGYASLGRFVALRPADGQPLLLIAIRHFFRREVEIDPQLAAGLTFDQLDGLSRQQDIAFRGLHEVLVQQGERLFGILDEVRQIVGDTHNEVKQTRDDIQLLTSEIEKQSGSVKSQLEIIQQLLVHLLGNATATGSPASEHRRALGPVAPVASEDTRIEQARDLVVHCQALPREQQRRLPALFRTVGRLKAEVIAYDACHRIRRGVLPSSIFATPLPDIEPVLAGEGPTTDGTEGNTTGKLRACSKPTMNPLFQPSPVQPASTATDSSESPVVDNKTTIAVKVPTPTLTTSIFGLVPKSKIIRKNPPTETENEHCP